MLRLCRGSRDCALAQLLTRSFSCPGAGINIAHDRQPFLGLRSVEKKPICSRKRSRPSSNRRLTKKLKRLSSGCSALGSAMGVVEEQRLSTNGPAFALAASPALRHRARAGAPDVCFGVGVIDSSPDRCGQTAIQAGRIHVTGRECGASRLLRDRGSPAVIGILPLDRWLCVPVFRRVCPFHSSDKCRSVAIDSQALILCSVSRRGDCTQYLPAYD